MGAFEWLLNKLRKVDYDKSNLHRPLHTVRRGHLKPMTKFNTFVRNSLTEMHNLNMSDLKATRTHIQEEELLAHMRLLSSEAKDWKSRLVSEAEQELRRESAEAAQRTTEVQEAMENNFKIDGDKLKQNSRTCVNLAALRYRPSQIDYERVSWNTINYILHMRDSCNWRHKPSESHKTWNGKQPI